MKSVKHSLRTGVRWLWLKRGIIAFVILALATAYSFFSVQQSREDRISFQQKVDAHQQATDLRFCHEIEKIKLVFREEIKQGLKDTAKLQYYKDHPEEFQTLVVPTANRQMAKFKPMSCHTVKIIPVDKNK